MNGNITVSASLLGGDLARMQESADRAAAAGADWLHFDVMDGRFVDNISFGSPVQRAIKTDLPIDTHLMVQAPERQYELFILAGSNMVTFHAETTANVSLLIEKIHKLRAKAGLAIKPATPAETVFPYLDAADMVLIMTVEPGRGGQGFIPSTLSKISAVREKAPKILIEVDGGINAETAPLVKKAGADVLVSGTYIFGAEDMRGAVETLRS